jgi:hypothetical protein
MKEKAESLSLRARLSIQRLNKSAECSSYSCTGYYRGDEYARTVHGESVTENGALKVPAFRPVISQYLQSGRKLPWASVQGVNLGEKSSD